MSRGLAHSVYRIAFAAILVAVALMPAAGSSTAPELQAVAQRFLSRPDEPIAQYRATRHLEASNDRFKKEATLDVVTELSPSGEFTYKEISATGSEYILNKVLRPVIQIEKTTTDGDPSKYALTESNYSVLGSDLAEPGIVKLLVKPRRKDANLIDGALFVTSEDSDLVRVEGRLVKNPSFWASKVFVIRRYARVGGVRVPVRLDTTAHLKLAGVSTMSMTYDYEMVNGVPVR